MNRLEIENKKLRLALELIKQKTNFEITYDVAGVCKQGAIIGEIRMIAENALNKRDSED